MEGIQKILRQFHGVVIIALLLLPAGCGTETESVFEETVVFQSGTDGYHTFRIPSVIVAPDGSVLAICEGRKASRSDTGNIDIVMKKSYDGGTTWGAMEVVWDDGGNVCGNPCPVVDHDTGTIWLLLTHNLGEDHEGDNITKTSVSTRKVYVSRSDDNGENWSEPVDITAMTKDPSWGWYATGPGVGIQIEHGPYAGRLVIPCDHSYDDPAGNVRGGPYEYGSHAIYSDDHGSTWKLGGTIRPKVNECQVVELADGNGSLLMNMRSYFGRHRRTHSISDDGGETWSDPVDVPDLIEPVCQASIIRYAWESPENPSGILLFSDPYSEDRENMTVLASFDDGTSWPLGKTLFAGPSAYSCLTVLPDGMIGCLYECGAENKYETITFARFSMDWLESQ
jgi:sialidase-1